MGKNRDKNDGIVVGGKSIDKGSLKRILREHERWIDTEKKEGKWADLSEARLSGVELYGVNLKGADLNRADLSGAILDGAILSGAQLFGADLSGASLVRADLRGANLRRAKLAHADLTKADLSEAYLSGADLSRTNLSKAKLESANLRRAILSGADLSKADLSGANLSKADLREAELPSRIENVNLAGARGVVLNRHDISKVRFGRKPSDPYHVLRRAYSGPAMIYNLIFLGAFVAPYGVRAAFFKLIHWTQEEGIIERINAGAEAIQITTGDEWMTWQLMLGLDKGPWYAVTAIVLLVYNIARFGLTRWMVGVREDVDQSGIAPAWNKYKWQYRFHFWILQVVFVLSLFSFLFHAIDWLFEPISVPVGWRAP